MLVRSNFSARAAAVMVIGLGAGLAGCVNSDFDPNTPWFTRPLDVSGKKGGYTFSELAETKKDRKPITASDVVDANGACSAPAAPGAPAAANSAPGAPAPVAGSAPADASLLGGGIALGMSECDVINRAGAPANVQIGKDPNGDRTAVLTFHGGPRPGIYRFAGGALIEMTGVADQAPPQVAKKKPAKSPKEKKSAQN